MNGIAYRSKFFKTEEEAADFKTKNGGAIYSTKYSKISEKLHKEAALQHNVNPYDFPYSVNWSEFVSSNSGLFG